MKRGALLLVVAAAACSSYKSGAPPVPVSEDGSAPISDSGMASDSGPLPESDAAVDAEAGPPTKLVNPACATPVVAFNALSSFNTWSPTDNHLAGGTLTRDGYQVHATFADSSGLPQNDPEVATFSEKSPVRWARLQYRLAANTLAGYAEIGCLLSFNGTPSQNVSAFFTSAKTGGVRGALSVVGSAASSSVATPNLPFAADGMPNAMSILIDVSGDTPQAEFTINGVPTSKGIASPLGFTPGGITIQCGVIYADNSFNVPIDVDETMDQFHLDVCAN